MKNRTSCWLLLLLLLFVGPAWSANMATFTVKNPGFSENNKFYVDIYATSLADNFELGISNLRIQFNDAVLSNPLLSEQNPDFDDNVLYDPMTVSLLGSNIVELLIAPQTTVGTILPSAETRLARITFEVNPVTNTTETAGIDPLEGTSTVKTADGGLVLIQFPGTLDLSLVCTPSISGSPVTSVSAGDAYDFMPAVSGGCDPVSFEIQNKPSWASFDDTSGELSGTPTDADVNVYSNIIIKAVDPDGDEAALTAFDIEVTAACQAPTISGTPDMFIKTNTSYNFAPTVSNGCPPLAFSGTNLPAWASLDSATGAITGTPVSADVGLYTGIDISVQDDNSALDTLAAFDIEVCDAVAIFGTPVTSIAAESAYSFIPAYSGCGDPVFQISNKPSWVNFDPTTGALSGTPTSSDAGTYPNIIISVADETNDSATLTAFNIEVTTGSSASGSGGGGGGGGGCFIATIAP